MLAALFFLNLQPFTAFAQGTAFTYQGRLNDGVSPATGIYDLRFAIYDAVTNGNLVAGPLTNSATGVTNGLFAVTLDFGSDVFTGPDRWLELDVRTNGGSAFTSLLPLQPVQPVPYSIMANTASNLLGTLPATQLSGTLPANQLSGTIPLAQLSASVLTNNANGVTLNGTFNGNVNGSGAGLTGVPGTFTWQNVTGTSQQAQPNTGYLATNAAQVTINLPASPNVGDIVGASGVGAGGWQIVQNTGHIVSYTNKYLFTGSETNITINPGTYYITAYGAQGGTGLNGSSGGLGAEMEAQFYFPTSTTLTLLVGGGGGSALSGGGGGGSFVVNSGTPLIIAGGGGGGSYGGGGTGGFLGGSGGTLFGFGGGAGGGTNGSGGAGGGANGGGGGGGYLGAGGDGTGGGYGGGGYLDGGFGGGGWPGYYIVGDGGFGGGGGGGAYQNGGGGGGGYGGGGGGDNYGVGGGGGGGGGGSSIIDSSAINIVTKLAGVQSGNGEVDIVQMVSVVVTNFTGGQNSAIQLQYIGDGQWQPVSQSQIAAGAVGSAQLASNLTISGSISAPNFVGNGIGLTNLNASQLVSGTLSDARLSTNVALLNGNQTFSGSNTFSGVSILTNTANQFAGNFIGSGAGLTGMNAANVTSGTLALAQLPAVVLTNNQTGVNLNGIFSGNGAGVTNVNLLTAKSGGLITWGTFFLASSPSVGTNPVSVAAADVNGDARTDLISANSGDNTLSVLTNNGSGGFALASTYNVGTSPRSVAAADVNGDGKTDLISANWGGNSLTVLTNNGTGGYALAATYNVGTFPRSVAAADVNGDGKTDLISANWGGNSLTVLTNDGSGGFVLAATYNVGNGPDSVVAANVNGDDKVDLITVNSGNNTLTVLTNDSNGGFALASSMGLGSLTGSPVAPFWLVTGDVNGDGYVDMVCARNSEYIYSTPVYCWNGHNWYICSYQNHYEYYGKISVLTNNGNGSFAPNGWQMQGGTFSGMTAADINEDGRLDLMLTGSANTLELFINNGNGGFAPTSTYNVGSNPNAVTATDISGDGKLDLVCANGGAGTLSVLLNTPTFNGNFTGSGGGLTGLNASQLTSGTVPLAQLPVAVVTNNASGITLSNATLNGTFNGSGTFSGNGAGLTGVLGTFLWQHVTGTSQQAQPNTGYIADNPLPVTITLPAIPNIGDIVRVSGIGGGGWIIAQNAGQAILPVPFGGFYTNWSNLTNWSLVFHDASSDNWNSIASSADGSKWVAASYNGLVVNQLDQSLAFPSSGWWESIASSQDGAKLAAAAASQGGIYTSTNSGTTVTQTSATTNYWSSIACSTNGAKLVAVSFYDPTGAYPGSIYTSANSGGTWTKISTPTNYWQAVASSADGTKLVAASLWNTSGNLGSIYTSITSGSSWTKTSAPSNDWQCVASSADGTKLVAASPYVGIYTSANSGSTWTLSGAPTSLDWVSVAVSANGNVLVAADGSGYIYVSTNFGTNWMQTAAASSWTCVAASANGQKLFAGDFSGNIYSASSLLPVTTTVGTAGYLSGDQFTAIELQYIGDGQWLTLSHEGTISSY